MTAAVYRLSPSIRTDTDNKNTVRNQQKMSPVMLNIKLFFVDLDIEPSFYSRANLRVLSSIANYFFPKREAESSYVI